VKTRILLADDQALTREGIRRLLDAEGDMEVVAEAASGQEALDLAQRTHPDVVIMDISMPELNGIQATQIIRRLFPEIQVVVQSGHSSNAYVHAMFNAGASAYVLKDFLSEDLLCAIRSVVAGKPYLGTRIRDRVDITV
jgi:DNA-binding NarL/FixJ family response regulator